MSEAAENVQGIRACKKVSECSRGPIQDKSQMS